MPLVENAELIQLENIKNYYKKHWLSTISSEELSIFELNITTNTAAESYNTTWVFVLVGILTVALPVATRFQIFTD